MKNLPDKIWLNKDHSVWLQDPKSAEYTEYVHKDAFIEMACEWLEAHSPFVNDDILNVWLDNFKKAMKL